MEVGIDIFPPHQDLFLVAKTKETHYIKIEKKKSLIYKSNQMIETELGPKQTMCLSVSQYFLASFKKRLNNANSFAL